MPFLVVFLAALLTFTGGLYLLLREEEKTVRTGIPLTSNLTSMNKGQPYPSETGYCMIYSTKYYTAYIVCVCNMVIKINAGVIH